MITVDFSEQELQAVIAGLRERENRMFNDAQAYAKNDNRLAQMDCIQEMHIAQHLRERLQNLAR